MTYAKDTQAYHISRIRAVIFAHPHAGCRQIATLLENDPQSPLRLDKDYVNRLMRKMEREQIARMDHQLLNLELAQVQNMVEVTTGILVDMIHSPKTSNRDKISAAKTIMDHRFTLLDMKVKSGLFARNQRQEKPKPLTAEQQASIAHALRMIRPKEYQDEALPPLATHAAIEA